MSEQAREVKNEAIPNWAQGLYYNKGLFSEAIDYHDGEAVCFEPKGKRSGVVRFPFKMIDALRKSSPGQGGQAQQG